MIAALATLPLLLAVMPMGQDDGFAPPEQSSNRIPMMTFGCSAPRPDHPVYFIGLEYLKDESNVFRVRMPGKDRIVVEDQIGGIAPTRDDPDGSHHFDFRAKQATGNELLVHLSGDGHISGTLSFRDDKNMPCARVPNFPKAGK
jgi:hypothetical protein